MSELIPWFLTAGTNGTVRLNLLTLFSVDSPRRLTVGLSSRCRMLQWKVIVAICSYCSSKALNSPMPLSLSDCTLHCHCPQCVCVKLCGVSFVSCPAQAVDQSGVQGRHDYTTACGLPLHCTAYTEPETEIHNTLMWHASFCLYDVVGLWFCLSRQVCAGTVNQSYLICASLKQRDKESS